MLLVNGVRVEDIDYYNRLHHHIDKLKPMYTRLNDQSEYGMGTWSQYNGIQQGEINISNYDWLGGRIPCAKDAPNGNWRWCSFSPLLGLFQHDEFLPLFAMGSVTLEMELVNNATDCIVAPPTAAVDNNPTSMTDTSTEWTISDCQIKCDNVTLDNSLQNE